MSLCQSNTGNATRASKTMRNDISKLLALSGLLKRVDCVTRSRTCQRQISKPYLTAYGLPMALPTENAYHQPVAGLLPVEVFNLEGSLGLLSLLMINGRFHDFFYKRNFQLQCFCGSCINSLMFLANGASGPLICSPLSRHIFAALTAAVELPTPFHSIEAR